MKIKLYVLVVFILMVSKLSSQNLNPLLTSNTTVSETVKNDSWFINSTCETNSDIKKNGNDSIPIVQNKPTYKVIVAHDITYAKGLSHMSVNSSSSKEMNLKLDMYVPNNSSKNRPLLMMIHGGGFSGGSKKQEKIVNVCNYFASRGWVVASIDYRLKKHNGTIPQEWIDFSKEVPKGKRRGQFYAMYAAHRDAKAALRWLMANTKKYHINKDYITVGGGSAGAITSVTLGISNEEDYRDELTVKQDPTLSSTHLEETYKIHTILNFWGSKIGLYVLEEIYGKNRFDKNDPPMFVFHGTEDPLVPYSSATDLQKIYKENNVPLKLYGIEGGGHGIWGKKVDGKPLEKLAYDFVIAQQKLNVEK